MRVLADNGFSTKHAKAEAGRRAVDLRLQHSFPDSRQLSGKTSLNPGTYSSLVRALLQAPVIYVIPRHRNNRNNRYATQLCLMDREQVTTAELEFNNGAAAASDILSTDGLPSNDPELPAGIHQSAECSSQVCTLPYMSPSGVSVYNHMMLHSYRTGNKSLLQD